MLLPSRNTRGFTLIELIVVILILGILAAVAVVGYSQFTDRAQATAAQANLRNIATAAVAERTLAQADTLTRDALITAALSDASVTVVDGLDASSTWTFYGRDYVPTNPGEYALAFDYADPDTADDNDDEGTRVVVVTSSGASLWARIITFGDAAGAGGSTGDSGANNNGGPVGQIPAGTTADAVLANPELISTDGSSNPGGNDGGDNGGDNGETPNPNAGYVYGLTVTDDGVAWALMTTPSDSVYLARVAPNGAVTYSHAPDAVTYPDKLSNAEGRLYMAGSWEGAPSVVSYDPASGTWSQALATGTDVSAMGAGSCVAPIGAYPGTGIKGTAYQMAPTGGQCVYVQEDGGLTWNYRPAGDGSLSQAGGQPVLKARPYSQIAPVQGPTGFGLMIASGGAGSYALQWGIAGSGTPMSDHAPVRSLGQKYVLAGSGMAPMTFGSTSYFQDSESSSLVKIDWNPVDSTSWSALVNNVLPNDECTELGGVLTWSGTLCNTPVMDTSVAFSHYALSSPIGMDEYDSSHLAVADGNTLLVIDIHTGEDRVLANLPFPVSSGGGGAS